MTPRPVSRRSLFRSAGALTAALAAPPAGAAPRRGVARTKRFLAPRVLVLNYDPIIEAEDEGRLPGGRRLHEVLGWNDPRYLAGGYIADVREASGGHVRYDIVEWHDLDIHPVKKDGFRYTDESFLEMWRGDRSKHREPDAIDYRAIIRDFDLERRVESGDIDEVWLFSYPYSGTWESTMAGRDAYFCNSDPVPDVNTSRIFVIMGFSYERGVGEMLENLGHRTESILRRVYGSWNATQPRHAWDRFTLYDKNAPGRSACGNVHFAPNSTRDYEWGSKTYVESTADDWLDYPNLTGKKRRMNCSDWGNGYIRSHHRWWFERLPKAPGRGPDGKLANWWDYVVDFNRFKESDGS